MGRFFMVNQRIRRVELADIVALHNNEPRKYQIPETRHINSIGIGDHVKVGVLNKDDLSQIVEHFWVRVIEIAEDGRYTGYIDNDPEILKNLKKKDKILLERKNIMASLIYSKPFKKAKNS